MAGLPGVVAAVVADRPGFVRAVLAVDAVPALGAVVSAVGTATRLRLIRARLGGVVVAPAVVGALGGTGGSDVVRALGHGRPPGGFGPVGRPAGDDRAHELLRLPALGDAVLFVQSAVVVPSAGVPLTAVPVTAVHVTTVPVTTVHVTTVPVTTVHVTTARVTTAPADSIRVAVAGGIRFGATAGPVCCTTGVGLGFIASVVTIRGAVLDRPRWTAGVAGLPAAAAGTIGVRFVAGGALGSGLPVSGLLADGPALAVAAGGLDADGDLVVVAVLVVRPVGPVRGVVAVFVVRPVGAVVMRRP
ncbi:hypothetical protein AB0M54_26785 [Actinoplanes sp. NPDC051470]|uniref:hypothetical protein n=1 Tax=Actinoplanes sp. NPDC051470 TaxID=3157224 RepID=UPI0034321CCA